MPVGYPPSRAENPEHATSQAAEWNHLFEEYAIPAERRKTPELEPVTHTPRSILGIGPIRLGKGATAAIDEDLLRRLLREFISAHAQLLGVSAAKLSLDEVSDAGSFGKRYAFVQTDYPHPIVSPSGRLEFVVSKTGDIIQISDTAIPAVELPTTPRIGREDAVKRVLGTTFTYGDIAGRPQTVKVTDPATVVARRLVVYPETTDGALFIHLAWEVVAGSGLSWTVYVDAIKGDTIATKQNFQT